ncbi:unnamed protein product, partial [Mesorhabditis belari]|uniref:Ubiquitinyl hydrolase variant UBP zinc finger domain-containing protein n=1 Tax=Mesorhabditis belari TaxID=2138241 RepID=A0AAF3EVK7_9BILA
MSAESVNSAEYQRVLQLLHQEHFTSPNADTKVYKDECIYCFNTPFFEGGLYVCLKTYCSFCPRHVAEYAAQNNCVAFIQHLSKKVKEIVENPAEPEQKISRLAVGIDGGFNNEKCGFVTCFFIETIFIKIFIFPEMETKK